MQSLPAGGQKCETGTPLNSGYALPYDDRRDDDHGWPYKPARMPMGFGNRIHRSYELNQRSPNMANKIKRSDVKVGTFIETRWDDSPNEVMLVVEKLPTGYSVIHLDKTGEWRHLIPTVEHDQVVRIAGTVQRPK